MRRLAPILCALALGCSFVEAAPPHANRHLLFNGAAAAWVLADLTSAFSTFACDVDHAYQERNCTSPVSSTGDPIGCIIDDQAQQYVAPNDGARPAYTTPVASFNNLSICRYDSSDDELTLAGADGNVIRSMTFVSANRDVSFEATLLLQNNNPGINYGWSGSSGDQWYLVNIGVAIHAVAASVTMSDNEVSYGTGVWDGSGNELFINGTSDGTDVDDAAGTDSKDINLGWHAGIHGATDMAEGVVWDAADQRAEVEGYEATKYGL